MPEIRERFEDTEELIRQAFDDFRRQLWTALPGKVVEDSDGKTAKVQPTIKGRGDRALYAGRRLGADASDQEG
jgi:hypothetical protein